MHPSQADTSGTKSTYGCSFQSAVRSRLSTNQLQSLGVSSIYTRKGLAAKAGVPLPAGISEKMGLSDQAKASLSNWK
jgi:hypothetical protein